MAAAVTIQTVDALGAEIYVSFNVTLSGSYVAGGDVLNFATAVADVSYVGLVAMIESTNLLQVDVWSQGGNLLFQYAPVVTKSGSPSTINPATGVKLKIGASATFGTELSAGAYAAGLTGDTITGFAIFTKML